MFAQELVAALSRHQLIAGDASASRSFATPRRLAVHVPMVRARADDRADAQRAGIDLHAKEWWWPVWRYGGWTLAGVALALTLYSGLGYLWRHRDLIAEE